MKFYLITGSTGAGKTTYSKELSVRENAVLFSIDQWMKNLFWLDAPKGTSLEWALERVKRCENQILILAQEIIKNQKTSIVLDLGFSTRDHRKRVINFLKSKNLEFELHFLDVPLKLRRQRVKKRNKNKDETYEFEVSEEVFNWMEGYFEPPSEEELEESNGLLIK